jgi:acetyl esterase/lipase
MRPASDSLGRRVLRRLLGAVLAVAIGAGGAGGAEAVYHTSLQPGAAIVTAVFSGLGGVTPPAGYAQIASTVSVRTVGSSGFPALRTYLWAYTGTRDWTSYPEINQLSTVRQVTAQYPPTFLSDGDADPFRGQSTELASALKSHGVPLTTLLWTGTGDGLGHEYQFKLNTPEASTALARTLDFLAATTKG